MSIKDRFVEWTNREGMVYSLAMFFMFKAESTMCSIRYALHKKKAIDDYFRSNSVRKIHLGAGTTKLPGFLNSDLFGEIPIDITRPLPFKNGSVDLLYSNHVVEHIHNKEFKRFLKESVRVLKKGGVQIIATPGLEKLVRTMYCDKSKESINSKKLLLESHRKFNFNRELTPASFLNNFMHINYGHKYLYDLECIKSLALEAGYGSVERSDEMITEDETINQHFAYKTKVGPQYPFETEVFILRK